MEENTQKDEEKGENTQKNSVSRHRVYVALLGV